MQRGVVIQALGVDFSTRSKELLRDIVVTAVARLVQCRPACEHRNTEQGRHPRGVTDREKNPPSTDRCWYTKGLVALVAKKLVLFAQFTLAQQEPAALPTPAAVTSTPCFLLAHQCTTNRSSAQPWEMERQNSAGEIKRIADAVWKAGLKSLPLPTSL